MKTIVLVIILTGMVISLNSQPKTSYLQDSLRRRSRDTTFINMTKNEFSFKFVLGFPWSVGAHVSFLSLKDLGIGFSVKLTKLKSSDRVVDFKKSTFNLKPGDILITYSLFFVKEFPTRKHNTQAGIELGVAFVDYVAARSDDQNIGSFMENFSSLGSSNYYIGYSHRYTLGMSYRLKLKFQFRKYTGLEMAIAGNLNIYKPYIGFELGWIISRRRNRIGN